MNWFKSTMSSLREASATEPFQCPRGWGEVSFHLSIDGLPPFYWAISRECPIGAAESCLKCCYPFNPAADVKLRESLEELEGLRRDGVLTEEEHATRRRMLIGMHEHLLRPPGYGFRITAWLLGPIGVILLGVGYWLAVNVHKGFWGAAAAGLLALGLCLSFAVLAPSEAPARGHHHPRERGS